VPTSSMLLVRNLSVVRYLLSAVVVVATSLMILSPVAARAGVRRLLTGSYFGVSSLETNAKQVAAAEAAHAARSGSVRTLGRAVFGIGLAIDTSLAYSQYGATPAAVGDVVVNAGTAAVGGYVVAQVCGPGVLLCFAAGAVVVYGAVYAANNYYDRAVAGEGGGAILTLRLGGL
jgi:hypothetical protein